MQSLKNVISLNQAAKISGYTQDYLGYLIRSGEIKGVKKGGIWFTTEEEVTHYISKQKAIHRKLAVKDFLEKTRAKISSQKLAVRDFISHLSPRNFLVSSLILFVAFSSTGFYFFKKYDSGLALPNFKTPSFVLALTDFTSQAKNISLPTFPTLPTLPNPFPVLKKIGEVYVNGVTDQITFVVSQKHFVTKIGESFSSISNSLSSGWSIFTNTLLDNGINTMEAHKRFADRLSNNLTNGVIAYTDIISSIPERTSQTLAATQELGKETTAHSLASSVPSVSQLTASVGTVSLEVGNSIWQGITSIPSRIKSGWNTFLAKLTEPKMVVPPIEVPSSLVTNTIIPKQTPPVQPPSSLSGETNTNPTPKVAGRSVVNNITQLQRDIYINQIDSNLLSRITGIELALRNNISHNTIQTDRVYDSTGNNLGSAIHSVTESGTLSSPTLNDATFANFTSTGRSDFTRVPTLAHSFTTWPSGTSNASNATLYINPASSVGNGNLIGASVADVVKFIVDAEGNIYANSLVLTGSVTSGATTVASLSVLDNTILGDAGTDTLTVNSTSTFNNNISQVGAYTFSTGTGAVSLNGDVSIASGKNFVQNGTGTFGTGSGIFTFNNVSTNLVATNPVIDATGVTSTLSINTVTNRPVTFGTGTITAPNISATTLTSSGNTTLATGINTTNTFGAGASSINTIGSVTTPGALTLHGATSLDNTFTVSGNHLTSLGGDLTVSGTAWTATPTISGLATLTSGLTSNGVATFNNNISQVGAYTFSTGTGAVSLNGDTTIASGKNFSQVGTGTFSTGTGAISLNGDTTIATGKTFTVTNGTTNITGATTILGTTLINSTGTSATTIGNATGLLTLHGAITLDNTFTISGNHLTSLGGDLTVSGTAWTATPTISGLITGTLGVSIGAGQSYTGAGAVTLSSAAASPLTLNSGTTGDINIGTDASAETINIGNTGAAGKIINIGNNATAGTIITIGSATNTDLALLDPNWSVTGAGAATFSSISGAISGAAGSFTTLTSSGASTIATGASLTNTFGAGTDAINTFGNATGTNAINGATTILGTTLINTTNTSATTIGNSTGTLALAGTTFALTAGSGLNVTTLGALSGITTIATSSTINSQTISATASFTGTLNVATGYKVNNAATIGTIIRGNGTNYIPSTATFADTYTASNLLYSNGASTVTGLATANSGVLVTNATGVPSILGSMTNGQLVVGYTGNTPVLATLTGTTDQIVVTNGAGTITLSSPQSINTTSTPQFARLGLGVAADAVNILTATSAATSDLSKTLNISHTGAITTGAGTGYAGYFSKTGASTTNVGLYTTATGATNNYSLQVDSGVAAAGTYTIYANGAAKNYFAGNIGIGDAAPATNLSVVGTAQIGYTTGTTVSAGTSLAVSGNVGIGTTGPNMGSWSSTVLTVKSPTANSYGTVEIGSTQSLTANTVGVLAFQNGATPLSTIESDTDGAINSGNIIFSTNNAGTFSEKVRINKSGNVGIGTTGPDQLLQIHKASAANSYVHFTNTFGGSGGTDGLLMGYGSAGGGTIWLMENENLTFGTNSLARMTIQNDGNVGIGTTGPHTTLEVSGANTAPGGDGTFNLTNTAYTMALRAGVNITGTYAWLQSAEVGNSNGFLSLNPLGGNVGIGTTGPNAKLEIKPSSYDGTWFTITRSDSDAFNPIRLKTEGASGLFEMRDDSNVLNVRIAAAGNSYINTSGNVGIGTTAPTLAKLQVAGGIAVDAADASASYNYYKSGVGKWATYNEPTNDNFIIREWGVANRLVIQPTTGNVGIGTTGPTAKLDVVSTSAAQVSSLKLRTDTTHLAVGDENSLDFQWYSTAYYGGRISGYVESTTGNGAGGLKFYTSSAGNALNATPSMTLQSNGNVGIGTTNPTTQLVVSGLGQTTSAISDSGVFGGTLFVQNTSGAAGSGGTILLGINSAGQKGIMASIKALANDGANYTAGDLAFSTRNISTDVALTERLRIQQNGNVGIGTTGPDAKLTVIADLTAGGGDATGFRLQSASGATRNVLFGGASSVGDNSYLQSYKEGTGAGVRSLLLNPIGGNVGIGTTNPGAKLDVAMTAAVSTPLIRAYNGTNRLLQLQTDASSNALAYLFAANDIAQIQLNTAGNSYLNGGNVGIGTTGPVAKLAVRSSGTTSSTYSFEAMNSAGATRFIVRDDGRIGFYGSDNGEKVTITETGNVGIGTTNPTTKFSVKAGTGQELVVNGMGTNLGMTVQSWVEARNALAPLDFSASSFSLTNGNVGIGTTSPATTLEANGTIQTMTAVLNVGSYTAAATNDAKINFFTNAQGVYKNWQINSNGTVGGALSITPSAIIGGNTFSTPAITILQDGKVGIGTTAPGYNLVVGSASVSGVVARFVNSTGYCDINPITTSLSCTSDINLKKNITNIKDDKEFALQTVPTDTASKSTFDKLMTLTPVKYNWNGEPDTATKHVGFIAQEVEQVFPDLVFTDSVTGLKSVAFTNLLPYTIEAIQEMNLKFTSINNMEKENTLRDSITAWLANGANKITRVFTGEVCLTDPGQEAVCINRSELQSLKAMVNQINTSGSSGGGSGTPPVVEKTATEKLADANAKITALVEASYTTESWTAFITAKDAALLLPETNDTEKLAKVKAIDDAVALLIVKAAPVVADLTAYNTALSAKIEADYTTDSWTTYKVVLDANIVTTANTQAQVDTATTNITTAQGSLAPKI